ncbi:MAG TPA: exonuclease domain-containing protein [Casimicrobiaceae bacterium]|nr:exonuclease domain-containing protein [Casimicrobiaceae bacterium]
MLAPAVAFVDLETTGMTAAEDRVTDVAIVRVRGGAVDEWSTLVHPQCSIPAAIQALTGITNAMVARAPTFERIADEVADRIAGCLLVAHNARFDYGFLKHEFARLGRTFTARVLCTVKLSRRLYPHAGPHHLDALVLRHGLPAADRHRALGDARILRSFVETVYRERGAEEIELAVRRILKTPSLPPQLAPDALDAIPETPGVYRFYGLNALPLYVGKSVNLRERVAAHFAADYRGANDQRLSAEIRRIEFEQSAGELGALLRESRLVKSLLPAYNQRLRKRTDMVALHVAEEPGAPAYVRSGAIDPRALDGLYGPFSSRRHARDALRQLAREASLCWSVLGLERRQGPCFARQLGRCAGACVGAETREAHHARLRQALATLALRRWPYPGLAGVQESSLLAARSEVHVFCDWCWLGTARDEADLGALIEAPPRAEFDLDIYRLLARRLGRLKVVPLGTACSDLRG